MSRPRFRTWHGELVFVALVLLMVWLCTDRQPIELVSVFAVLGSFAHGSVSERLREREAARVTPDVECHAWSTRYFMLKELGWCSYFVLRHAWSALAGVGLFLLYPAWRRWWRKRHPLESKEPK
jgi:hypothetical protein